MGLLAARKQRDESRNHRSPPQLHGHGKQTALAEKLDAVQVKAEDGLRWRTPSARSGIWHPGQASVVHDMKVRIRYNGEDYSAVWLSGLS